MKKVELHRSKVTQPVAGTAVINNLPGNTQDPYEQLADLMMVIEELCPQWPQRKTFKDSDIYLL